MKNLKSSTIKNAANQSQTIDYKGAKLTAFWGGEFFTAHYKGEIYRQSAIAALKLDILNGWAMEFGGDVEGKNEDVQACLLREAQNLEGEKVEINTGDEVLTVVCSTSINRTVDGDRKATRWTIRDGAGVGSSFLSVREALRYLKAFAPAKAAPTENDYFEIVADMDGETETLFGSFDKSEIAAELDAERDNWKGQGYKKIRKTTRTVNESPDPEIYGDGQTYKEAVCRALSDKDITVTVGDASGGGGLALSRRAT